MFRVYLYIAELIRAALYDRQPAEKPEDIEWEKVYALAGEHMVASLTFDSISALQNKPQKRLYEMWKEAADKALVKEISFDAERCCILEAFEEANIKYLPLKGIILKDFYKRPGLRQFSDNDILYETSRKDDVLGIMENLGYEADIEEGHHDVYQKEPIYNFELHTQLLPEKNRNCGYFKNIWQRAVKDEGNQAGYHMSEEDFYLFHLVHLQKHFGGSGTGLRYFVDQYYLEKDMLKKLNGESLKKKLEELDLSDFEERLSGLTKILFGKSDVEWESIFDGEGEYKEMFLYVMSSGAYGKFSNLVANRMKKQKNKFRYFLSRLTCEDVYMKHDYPVLKKAPWLKPVFVVWRLVSAPFKKTEKVKTEFRMLFGRRK